MAEVDQDLERLKLFVDRVETESNLAWSRANYFLVVISILAVAYTQNPTIVPHVATL